MGIKNPNFQDLYTLIFLTFIVVEQILDKR